MTNTIDANTRMVDWPSKVADLEKELAEAKKALEDFKQRASDILGDAADSHDLCEAYDQVAEEAGLYRRLSQHDVEVQVTYRQTITLRARSYEEAAKEAANLPKTGYLGASNPYQASDFITDVGTPYSLTITVPNDIF